MSQYYENKFQCYNTIGIDINITVLYKEVNKVG